MVKTDGNRLFYGDNLEILRKHIADDSVDLVYLDPPFNSNRSYNVLFKTKSGADAQAQIEAFDDTWTWSQQSEAEFAELVGGSAPIAVADAIEAMRKLLGDNDLLAYLVMMTARLLELHRVLKQTGTLYLHCDPTASHYLKIVLDGVFGPTKFRGEIVWKRTTAHSDSRQGRKMYGRVHDIILVYTKSDEWTWNLIYSGYNQTYVDSHYRFIEPETGRHYRKADLTAAKPGGDTSYSWKGVQPYKGRYWAYSRENMEEFDRQGLLIYTRTGMPELKRYLDEMPGVSLQDVWTDVDAINAKAAERLGYPTQKPLLLLERIIEASTRLGDVVLDPFCGCGTTVAAAQKLGRSWLGIDISYLSIALIQNRLADVYGADVTKGYQVVGIPHDLAGANALFDANAFDFERWAVTAVGGQANDRNRQRGDKGIDGVIRFPLDNAWQKFSRAIVSVKGGKTLSPAMTREVIGTVEREGAAMGILITMKPPTKGMIDDCNRSGAYVYELTQAAYPRLQIITVAEILAGKHPNMPNHIPAYTRARRVIKDDNQLVMPFAP